MKLLELDLIAFGPFTDCRIDLSGGKQGLHIIYGPNEAGKSSSLLAITYLLYGFPSQTSADFRHPYKNLRIGGRLQHSDQREIQLVRRKAHRKSLRCGSDDRPLEDDALAPFVGQVDQELFRSMFGINHERLREGGQQIARGHGRLGEMLFAAGAGLVDLQHVQSDLQTHMDGLLKASGRSGSIHSGVQEYLQHRKQVEEALVGVEAWNRVAEQLRAGRQRKGELEEQIHELQCQLDGWQRIHSAAPLIDRWQARRSQLLAVHSAPRLPADFAATAQQLLLEQRAGEVQLAEATQQLANLNQQLQQVVVAENILQAAESIEALRDRLGAIRAAVADRPGVELKCETYEREAKQILRDLDRQPDLSVIDDLRLPRDKAVKIQSLGQQLERLHERWQAERKLCGKLQRDVQATEQRQQAIPASDDVAECRAELWSVQQQGDLEAEAASSQASLDELNTQLESAMKRLPLVNATAADVEHLPLPSTATLDRFENEFQLLERQSQTEQMHLEEDQQQLDSLQAQLAALESLQAIPSIDQLEASRHRRDLGWQIVLRSLQGQPQDDRQLDQFMQDFPTAHDLPSAYQQAVHAADALADSLRHDADRVATKVKLQADYQQTLSRQQRRAERLSQIQSQLQTTRQQWQDAWRPTGLQPLAPAEMRDWLRKHEAILVLLQQQRQQQQRHEQVHSQLASARQRLLDLLRQVAPGIPTGHKTLVELLKTAQEQIDGQQSMASLQRQLTDRLAEQQAELVASQAELARCESELTAVQEQWSDEMQHLGLERGALPAQANSRLDSLNTLFEKFKEADRYRSLLEHIKRDVQQFTSQLQTLLDQLAPELGSQPYDSAFADLYARLEQARRADATRRELQQRQQQLQHKLAQANAAARQSTAQLQELMRQAQVHTQDQLASAAEQSRLRNELECQVSELEDEIRGYAAGKGLEPFVEEVQRQCAAEQPLEVRIASARQKLQDLRDARDAVLGQIRSGEIDQERFDGSGLAAERDATCESLASRLEHEVHTLAVLRVASAVLKEGIERHRQKNQAPVLARASAIFRAITLGQYTALQAEFNERGEPVLAGIRATEPVHSRSAVASTTAATASAPSLFDLDNPAAEPAVATTAGERVTVEGMSDGTCDQLYLALRLASLESWLKNHEPLPLIVDDILMNFDDARAVATLKILAELSRQTQVIFFTHHQHLVDLAREHLPAADLLVTPLGPGQ